jgi:hypothetical protein
LTCDDVRARLRSVDALLQKHELRAVIFDSRHTDGPSGEARTMWWNWLERGEFHDRVAVVANSEMVRVSGNLTALSKKVAFRSFETMEDAAAWVGCEDPDVVVAP